MAMAMACWINTQAVATKPKPQTQACSSLSPSEKCAKLFASQLSSTSSISSLSICSNQILIRLQKAPSFAIYPKQQVPHQNPYVLLHMLALPLVYGLDIGCVVLLLIPLPFALESVHRVNARIHVFRVLSFFLYPNL